MISFQLQCGRLLSVRMFSTSRNRNLTQSSSHIKDNYFSHIVSVNIFSHSVQVQKQHDVRSGWYIRAAISLKVRFFPLLKQGNISQKSPTILSLALIGSLSILVTIRRDDNIMIDLIICGKVDRMWAISHSVSTILFLCQYWNVIFPRTVFENLLLSHYIPSV